MFGIGGTELLVILVIALLVLGPKSLPQIARTLGKAMGEFRRVSTDFQRTLNTEIELEEHEKRKKEAEDELYGEEKTASVSASVPVQAPATGSVPAGSPAAGPTTVAASSSGDAAQASEPGAQANRVATAEIVNTVPEHLTQQAGDPAATPPAASAPEQAGTTVQEKASV